MGTTLRGTVQSGRREAAGFLALPWVADQLRGKAGLVPYPGTLNVRLTDSAALDAWRELRGAERGLRLASPNPAFCDASCFPAVVNGRVRGLAVVPCVPGYPPDVVEVVAAEGLRECLGLADGDEVTLTLTDASSEDPDAERFSCVLFDFEGTLVDFQWRLADAEAELRGELAKLGFDLEPFARDNYAVLRTRALELAPSDEVRELVDQRFGPIYDRYDADALSRWSLIAGARELLGALRASGRRLALVTNIGRRAIERALPAFGLDRAFDAVVTRNDAARAKPSGDGLLRALGQVGQSPRNTLMVGDSLSDLLAARDAGVFVAIVRGGESPAADVQRHGPDFLLASLDEVAHLLRSEQP
ncbi:MAG: HAD-IA family hydrolase [Deltaproteobacteria bacterium]|nr:HAD-IA family hydrolase [Deltaproteobacteria bacterium]